MATIVIKNIPDELYEDLKLSARANHRSINREVIACIERVVCRQNADPDAVLVRARELRELTRRHPITNAQLTKAKRAGRP